jgi:DNA-binding transcriptional regulator YiaG
MITKEQITEARRHVEETQTAFCIRLGVDQATLSRWENGGPPEHGPTQVVLASVINPILQRKAKADREGAAA